VKVLLTGAAGFVGSHVGDELDVSGHQVVRLDALLPQVHPVDTAVPPDLVVGEVQNAGLLSSLLDGVDAVCHQAAMVGHGLDIGDAPAYASNNDLATAVLLAAMHRAGVGRLVLASSMVVYGEGRYRCPTHDVVRPGARRDGDLAKGRFEPPCPVCGTALEPLLVPEDAPLDPRSVYAATKLAQEHLAAAWARQTGGTVWALRYHNVYGPRMPRNTPYAGVASLFRSALARGEPPRVLEDGRQRRDFVHVHDVARANALALRADLPAGTFEPVNVCSGQPRTVGELAQALATVCAGPPPIVVGGSRPADVRHVVADPAKASRVLGFQAAVPFEAGIAQLCAPTEFSAPTAPSVPAVSTVPSQAITSQ